MNWQQRIWQKKTWITYGLMPFSWLFYLISLIRKFYLKRSSVKSDIPVIVVGNISVGGNGKTPVLITLANYLKDNGYRPAIVSRGYKAETKDFPFWCDASTAPFLCGDEPAMIAQETGLPVVIDPNRSRAVAAISRAKKFNVILSDDGLQHYQMHRDFEIAVVGSLQALGNQLLLPAGPLREPVQRLKTVDWVLGDKNISYVHYGIDIQPVGFYHVNTGQEIDVSYFKGKKVQAISGIALPERFHALLQSMGLDVLTYNFPDHHSFSSEDFSPFLRELILMTEKDAVKCKSIKLENAYFLKIKINLDSTFLSNLLLTLG